MQEKDSWDDDAWDAYESVSKYTVQNTARPTKSESTCAQNSFTPHGAASAGVPLVLIGLEAICNAVGAGPRTVKRWVDADGFPARRCSDGVYRADPRSVQRWFSSM